MIIRVLREGCKGDDVALWQTFLRGRGLPISVDSRFGPETLKFTKLFQGKENLKVDGVVGSRTLGRAMSLGLNTLLDDDDSDDYPPIPAHLRSLTPDERHERFGRLVVTPSPTEDNPERVIETSGWAAMHVVRAVVSRHGDFDPIRLSIHTQALQPLTALFGAWKRRGLLSHILTFDGSWNLRYIRGSTTILSAHAWATAFDINAQWNALGAAPAPRGRAGSVFDLVEDANRYGWWWGGHYKNRKDGMHFEFVGGGEDADPDEGGGER